MANLSFTSVAAVAHIRRISFKYANSKYGLRPFATVPAYVYHPHVTILEGEKQAMHLTKSVFSTDPLPSTLPPIESLQSVANELEGYIKDCIIQSRVYGYREKIAKRDYHNISLTQNMLRVLSTQAGKYPQLLDRGLTYKPKISVNWKRNQHRIAVTGCPGYLLSTPQPLTPFAHENEVKSTLNIPVQDLSPVSPVIDISEYSVRPDTTYGFHPGSPYPYPHTLFIVDRKTKSRPTSQMLSHGIMYNHAILQAVAINILNMKAGQELDHPLAMNTIMTNGRMFAFIYYQLNTLNLQHDDGVKNLVWIKHTVPLFHKVKKKEGIIRFGQQCWQLWLSTVMNGIDLQDMSEDFRNFQQQYRGKNDQKMKAIA